MDLRNPRTRLLIVAAVAALWTGAALGRLAYLQLFRYSEYYSRAQHQQRSIVEVGARRAEIFDRNLNPLAMSVPVDSAFAVPSEISDPDMVGMRSASEPYAQLLAKRLCQRFSSDWGLSETGATGPKGNRYGDAAGHSCMAVSGPAEQVTTLETGSAERLSNMHVFASTALNLLLQNLSR